MLERREEDVVARQGEYNTAKGEHKTVWDQLQALEDKAVEEELTNQGKQMLVRLKEKEAALKEAKDEAKRFLGEGGTVLQLATLGPGVDKEGLEVPSVESAYPVRFVRETAAGWMERNGVGVGDRVAFSEVVEGLDPE